MTHWLFRNYILLTMKHVSVKDNFSSFQYGLITNYVELKL